MKVKLNNTTVFSVDLGEESTEIDVDEVISVFSSSGL